MKKYFKYNKFGFTLAEVLITLGIIGIIAEITIPTLIGDFQKVQTVTQLKKTYSILSQMLARSVADNGEMSTWDWPAAPDSTNVITFCNQYIFPYFNIHKNCGYQWGWSAGNCHDSKVYYLDKTTTTSPNGATFILSDGTLITFNTTAASAATIWIDLNGNKPPNIVSKDVFYLVVMSGKLRFYPGWWDTASTSRSSVVSTAAYGCNKAAVSSAGISCGFLMYQDGWQMKDDYPW